MAKYKDKWKTTFPTSIGNQTRPEDSVDNTQEYNTDGLPQYMANDPVRYDLQNAVNSQLVSNDERLNEKIKRTSDDLAAHNKDPKAHATGIAGNAATASKLLTPRTISLTGKAAGSTSFDGSSNAAINVTSVNADTASKLSTARKINITGNASGSAAFDGSGDVSISTTVNESKHAAAADTLKSSAATETSTVARPVWLSWEGDNTKQTVSPNLTYTCSTKTLTTANFKGHLAGNADSATNADSASLISPFEIATANAFRNVWFSDSDTNNKACYNPNIQYNPSTNVLKVGTVQGTATNADTATTANTINHQGSKTAIGEGTKEPSGLNLYGVYHNGYPVSYGNLLSIGGAGGGELLAEWSGGDKGIGHLYYRNRRDAGYLWSDWRTVAFTSDINSFAPTKTGGGASGTWGINISGNAASATNADKLDGYHASDLLRTLGGNRTPVITDIFDRAGTIDMSTMSEEDKATHKANINKAANAAQNIWNTDTGIHAYGGDYDISGGYIRGTLKLTQSYKNFDKIMVIGTEDKANFTYYKLWDVWELANAFANNDCFMLITSTGNYWTLVGTAKHGNAIRKLSTDTIWSCQQQNSGIVAIYGIKY